MQLNHYTDYLLELESLETNLHEDWGYAITEKSTIRLGWKLNSVLNVLVGTFSKDEAIVGRI